MIVTLGQGTLAASSSITYQYNAQSLQKIYIKASFDAIGADASITVQIGNRTLVNNASLNGLMLINASQVGGYNGDVSASALRYVGINLGSHVCGSDTIYVTVTNANNSVTLTALVVGALVNEPVQSQPFKLTQYSDSSFADQNTLQAYFFSPDGADLISNTTSVEIRNSSFSITNQVQAYVMANTCDGFIDQVDFSQIGKLMSSSVPLSTTFNKSASADLIICVSAMDNSPQDRAIAKRQAGALKSVLSPSERRAL